MSTLRFRDGERDLPDSISARMAGIDVRRLTYAEALAAANRKEMSDYLNREQQRVVRDHMTGQRRP